jgi:hypothetical protein
MVACHIIKIIFEADILFELDGCTITFECQISYALGTRSDVFSLSDQKMSVIT